MQQFTEMFNMLCNREARFSGTYWGDAQIEVDVHTLATTATKLILNDKGSEVVDCIKDRMEAPDVQKRLLAFWLLDRTCQELPKDPAAPQVDRFIKMVEPQLYGMLRLITGGAEQPGVKQICFNGVNTILTRWSQKRTFKPAVIANLTKQMTGCMQSEHKKDGQRPSQFHLNVSVGAGTYDKQQMERMHQEINIPHEEEPRHEADAKRLTEKEKQARDLMEQQRSSQKREKLERALRPVGEAEDGEFQEMWSKVLRQEQERERFANAEEDFWARWKRSTQIWRPEFPKGPNGKLMYGRPVSEDGEDMATASSHSSSETENLSYSRRKRRAATATTTTAVVTTTTTTITNAATAEAGEKVMKKRHENEVWIWELDALTGERMVWDLEEGQSLGNKMKTEMFSLADRLLFFQDLEPHETFHILEHQRYDDSRDLNNYDFANDGGVQREGPQQQTLLAYRYRRVQQLYDHGLHRVLGEEDMSRISAIFEESKRLLRKSDKSSCEGGAHGVRKSWIEVALSCVQRIKQGGGKNVVICSAPLIPSLAKCLLSGLGAEFPCYTIYSGDTPAALAKCFGDIAQRFGKDCDYHVVYDYQADKEGQWRNLPQVLLERNMHCSQISAVEDVQGLLRTLNAPKQPRPVNSSASVSTGSNLPQLQAATWAPTQLPPNPAGNSTSILNTIPPQNSGMVGSSQPLGTLTSATNNTSISMLANPFVLPTNGLMPPGGLFGNWPAPLPAPPSPTLSMPPSFLPAYPPAYDPRHGPPQAPTFFPAFFPQAYVSALPQAPGYFMPQYRAPNA